jgi:cytochrome b6-f complex iron-sulfur subunit
MSEETREKSKNDADRPRRSFLGFLTTAFMFSGLMAGYGAFIATAGRFLFPAGRGTKAWQFVATLNHLHVGDSLPFETPAGEKIVVARQGEGDTPESFIALSSVCPHLGCSVHWESQNDRFFCPCHNGAFDASGKAISGPPAAAHQELARFPLKVENGLLYIQVSLESVNAPREA